MDNSSYNYEDIINLPRHISRTRPQMPLSGWAAQYSPFAALTGFDDEVSETARLTDEKLSLTEDRERELNAKLALLAEKAAERPLIKAEYFIPDKNKTGGAYVTVKGNFRRLDEYSGKLVLTGGEEIPLENIFDIELF